MVGLTRVCENHMILKIHLTPWLIGTMTLSVFPPIQFLPGLKYRITEEDIIS